MYLLLLFVFVGWLSYKWLTSNDDYFKKRGVPYIEPVPLFGNALPAMIGRESVVDLFNRGYNKFKHLKQVLNVASLLRCEIASSFISTS